MTWTAKSQHGNEQIDQQHIGCQRKEILQKTRLGFCEFVSWVVNQPNIQWSRIKLAAKGKLHISALPPAFFLFCTQIIWYVRKKKLNTYFWETIQEFFPLCLWLWWLAWCLICYRKTRYWRSGASAQLHKSSQTSAGSPLSPQGSHRLGSSPKSCEWWISVQMLSEINTPAKTNMTMENSPFLNRWWYICKYIVVFSFVILVDSGEHIRNQQPAIRPEKYEGPWRFNLFVSCDSKVPKMAQKPQVTPGQQTCFLLVLEYTNWQKSNSMRCMSHEN